LLRLAGAASGLESGSAEAGSPEGGSAAGSLVGAAAESDEQSPQESDTQSGRMVAQPARLLTDDARAALRLLAPFLVQGNGSGFAARLPYDFDLR
jgi:hypothetical protein